MELSRVATFNADSGNLAPMPVPFAGYPASDTQNLRLGPGETLRLTAAGSERLQQGWAEMFLPPGITGHAVFRQSVAGRADQEAVALFTTDGGKTAEMAFDDAGLTTTLAVANPTVTPVLLTIRSFGDDGRELGVSQVPLPPLSKRAYVLRELPGQSGINGKRGRIRLEVSGGGLSAMGFRFGGEAFTTIPVNHRK